MYGKKALACSIDHRTRLTATRQESNNSAFGINLKDIRKNVIINADQFASYRNEFESNWLTEASLDTVMEYILKTRNSNSDRQIEAIKFFILSLPNLNWSDLSGFELEIKTDILLASGLGSSASFSTCLASFFLVISNALSNETKFTETDLDLINEHAFHVEKLFHGKPSGIDNTVSTYGRYILFENGKIVERFDSNLELNVLIINSNVPKLTCLQVEKVRCLYERHKEVVECLLSSIDCLVGDFVSLIKTDRVVEESDLKELINMNQGILFSLQVSNNELNTIVNLAHKYKFATKITGAGGGGCCYSFLGFKNNQSTNELYQLMCNELSEQNFTFFRTKLGCEGVLLEQKY